MQTNGLANTAVHGGSPRDAEIKLRARRERQSPATGKTARLANEPLRTPDKKAMRRHFVLECVCKQRLLPAVLGKGGRLCPKIFVKRIFKQFTLRPKGTIIFSAKLTARVKCHV